MHDHIEKLVDSVCQCKLKNGLQILLHEDHTLPYAAMHTFWQIGTRNERLGLTGLAHFIEHMMFNGGEKYGPHQFDEIMEAHGGANNAYTNQNVTVYQNGFPAQALATIFDLEADRIAHLNLDRKSFAAERKVIASERRSTVESDNFEVMYEKLWATAFQLHPYGWPVIGWHEDIQKWKLSDLQEFYRQHYTPQNATMVLVGDFEGETTLRLCESYFGEIPRRAAPPALHESEPQQVAERRASVHRPAQLPAFTYGFHVPASTHPDHHALHLLEILLVAGQSSRCYQRLVDREQAAVWVRSDYSPAFDPSLFVLTVQLREDRKLPMVEKQLDEELSRFSEEPVPARELDKAKNICRAAFVRGLTTMTSKAEALGNAALYLGDFRKLRELRQYYDAVTADDIQRVAQTYFHPQNRTVVTLLPESD